jgi:hypothetical protein
MEKIRELIEEGFSYKNEEGMKRTVEVFDGKYILPLWTFRMLADIFIYLTAHLNQSITFEKLLRIEQASSCYADYDKQLFYNINSIVRE